MTTGLRYDSLLGGGVYASAVREAAPGSCSAFAFPLGVPVFAPPGISLNLVVGFAPVAVQCLFCLPFLC